MEKLRKLIRPNILDMQAYRSAQDEAVNDEYRIKLDANESPFGIYNRYPDARHTRLKSMLAEYRGVDMKNLVLTNGSDECIDLVFRMCCVPGKHGVLSFSPGFGMYKTVAQLNNVEFFEWSYEELYSADKEYVRDYLLKHSVKLIILCSPNNPSGHSTSFAVLKQLLEVFDGFLLVDEAYIDYSEKPSALSLLCNHNQLIVMQSFSKAFAAAALRIGAAFAHSFIIEQLEKMRMPYNISALNQARGIEILQDPENLQKHIRLIKDERERLRRFFTDCPFVKTVFESDANFLLVQFNDADKVFRLLSNNGIQVRDRQKQVANCLRITVGSPEENNEMMKIINKEIYAKSTVY